MSEEAADPVERLRRGDLVALGEIYDQHHEHVRAFARRLLGDASAAEDLVQETFVTLASALAGYRGDAPLRVYLLSIAVNHARHHLRAAVRRRAALARSAGEPPPSGPRTPLDEAQRQELAGRLTRALDELPLGQRAAIVLCEVEDRASREVAEILGIPEATVRTRVFHAKRKLREMLEGEEVR